MKNDNSVMLQDLAAAGCDEATAHRIAENIAPVFASIAARRALADQERIARESRKLKDLDPLTGMAVRFCRNRPPKRIKARVTKRGRWLLPGVKAKGRMELWDVPATGGYVGGWETGKALAYALLKNANATGKVDGYDFQQILLSAIKATEREGGFSAVFPDSNVSDMTEAQSSKRGQLCGFIQCVGDWACSAAVKLVGEPHNLSQDQIIGLANRGLAYSQEDHDAVMLPIWEAEEAADGAKRRAATTAKRRALRLARTAVTEGRSGP